MKNQLLDATKAAKDLNKTFTVTADGSVDVIIHAFMDHTAHDTLPRPARSISREEMANLPIRRYEGEVCQVATLHELTRAVHDIGSESVVGFDTETRPSFRKGESHLPCLVQVATADTVYLFSFRGVDVSAALIELLEAPRLRGVIGEEECALSKPGIQEVRLNVFNVQPRIASVPLGTGHLSWWNGTPSSRERTTANVISPGSTESRTTGKYSRA